MKKSIISTALALMLAATSPVSLAGHGKGNGGWQRDTARVIKVEPVVRVLRIEEPRTECRYEEHRQHKTPANRSAAPMVIGGVVGGIVGNQFGRGSGNDAATIAGTLLGVVIGDEVGRNSVQRADYREQEHCRTVTEIREKEVVDGYLVTYRYGRRDYVTEMDHDPGRRIKVQALVKPAGRPHGGRGGDDHRHQW